MEKRKIGRFPIAKAIVLLRKEIKKFKMPIVTKYAAARSPFKVLISTLLSLRTKDQTTEEAANRLFKAADTPEKIAALAPAKLEKLIYPVGFYRVKAKTLRGVCTLLLDQYAGEVPSDLDELLKIKGVGRKTANLVVTMGFNLHGICVDTHVHRISNLWGYVDTTTPDKTEFALRKKLPVKYWIEYNDLLVTYGQNVCVPVSPFCSRCKLKKFCPKIGVTRRR